MKIALTSCEIGCPVAMAGDLALIELPDQLSTRVWVHGDRLIDDAAA